MKDSLEEELNNCKDMEDFEILITEISESSKLSEIEKEEAIKEIITYFNTNFRS